MSKEITEKEIEAYKKRKEEYRGKQKDNASLPAGSCMYYYCRHCGAMSDCRAESDFGGGPIQRVCDECRSLEKKGYFDK
jgi:hypothetical protein